VLRELSHEIDYVIELFGLPIWVSASTAKVSDLDIDVEDIAHLTFGMKDSAERNFMASLHLDFVRQDTTRNCTVIGTEGTLQWDVVSGLITHMTANPEKISTIHSDPESTEETYFTEWANLVRAIESDTQPKNVLRQSIDTLQVILACERSQQTGSKVEIEYEYGINHD
jgi:predicted dehydrogenase